MHARTRRDYPSPPSSSSKEHHPTATAVLERFDAVRVLDAERPLRKELMLPCDDAPVEWLPPSWPMARSQEAADALRCVSGCGWSSSSGGGCIQSGRPPSDRSPSPDSACDRTSSEPLSDAAALGAAAVGAAGSALRWRLLPALGFGLGGSQTSGRRNRCPIGRVRGWCALVGRSRLCQLAARKWQAGKTRGPKKKARARVPFCYTPSPPELFAAGPRRACCTSRLTRGSDGQRPGPPLALAATALGIVPKKPAMSTRERILQMPVRRAVAPRTSM